MTPLQVETVARALWMADGYDLDAAPDTPATAEVRLDYDVRALSALSALAGLDDASLIAVDPVRLDVTDEAVEVAWNAYWSAYSEAVRNAPSNRGGRGITSGDGESAGRAGMAAALRAASPLVLSTPVAGHEREKGYRYPETDVHSVCEVLMASLVDDQWGDAGGYVLRDDPRNLAQALMDHFAGHEQEVRGC